MIGKWLNAGIMEKGQRSYSETGTPQGGVISPLLANIYLHTVLDQWFGTEVLGRLTGQARLFRYADDFIIVCRRKDDADRILSVLPKRFERFGLQLHPDKTRLVDFSPPRDGVDKSATFNFLGFTFYWGKTRDGGRRVVKLKTERSRIRRAATKAWELCRKMRHWSIKDQQARLNRGLRGHYNYFGVSFNMADLKTVRLQVIRAWEYWLARRSGKRSMTWEAFNAMEERFPLITPRIIVRLF
jgi:hypothetical protein